MTDCIDLWETHFGEALSVTQPCNQMAPFCGGVSGDCTYLKAYWYGFYPGSCHFLARGPNDCHF